VVTEAETACLAGSRCLGGDVVSDASLCELCLSSAARDVGLLVHDYRDLEQLLPKPLGVWDDGQPHASGKPGSVVPLRLDVEALQREIWWLSTAWAEVVGDRDRLADPPRGVRDGFAVAWAARILAPRVRVLAQVPSVLMATYPRAGEDETRFRSTTLVWVSGAQGVLDLVRAHSLARSVLGLTEPVYELPGRCQVRACGRPALRVKDGSDTVWCDHCGAVMTRDDYDRYGNLFLREAA
jgi:hypothetical protein